MHWLQNLDVELFRFINLTLSNPFFDRIMPFFSGTPLFVPLLLVIVAVMVWRAGIRGRLCVVMLALVVCLGDPLVVNLLKHSIERLRPFNDIADAVTRVGRGGSFSMPSAHAANWFAATMVLFIYYRRSFWFMLPLAVLVSFSRIYNGVHYPTDAVVGAVLGAGYAAALVWSLDALWRSFGRKWFPLWWQRLPSLVSVGKSGVQEPKSETGAAPAPDQHWLRLGYVLIAVLCLSRLAYLASGMIELSEDEAYYWLWSKHPALSYFSKPPLVAYTQLLGTTVWGDTAFGVRFFSPVIAAIVGFLLLRFLAREVGARAGVVLLLIISTTPLLAVGAALMTIDPLSVLFWTAAMLAGWRAIQEKSTARDWLWVGLWMGLGFLSKYTALFQWLCWGVLFVLWPPARKQLLKPGPWLALLVNVVCMLPVLTWNHQHEWVTVAHVADDAGAGRPWEFTFRFFLDFIGAEAVLLNPVFFLGAIWASVAFWRRHRNDGRLVYCFSMGAPLFLSYLLFTFHSRALPNWIAPSVLPLFCVMVIYWHLRWRDAARFARAALVAGLGFGAVAVILLHDTNLVGKIAGQPLPPKPEPLTRVRAYSGVARVVGEARTKLLAEGKPVFILGGHYGITSLITFYLPEARARAKADPFVYCRSSDRPANQFHFWPGYQGRCEGQNAIFVRELDMPGLPRDWFFKWLVGENELLQPEFEGKPAPPWLLQEFDSVTDVGLYNVLYRGRVFHCIQIFECRNLR